MTSPVFYSARSRYNKFVVAVILSVFIFSSIYPARSKNIIQENGEIVIDSYIDVDAVYQTPDGDVLIPYYDGKATSGRIEVWSLVKKATIGEIPNELDETANLSRLTGATLKRIRESEIAPVGFPSSFPIKTYATLSNGNHISRYGSGNGTCSPLLGESYAVMNKDDGVLYHWSFFHHLRKKVPFRIFSECAPHQESRDYMVSNVLVSPRIFILNNSVLLIDKYGAYFLTDPEFSLGIRKSKGLIMIDTYTISNIISESGDVENDDRKFDSLLDEGGKWGQSGFSRHNSPVSNAE